MPAVCVLPSGFAVPAASVRDRYADSAGYASRGGCGGSICGEWRASIVTWANVGAAGPPKPQVSARSVILKAALRIG
ncbi:hypothetical protein GCM10009730_17340 [Streptomyces albidochromogenes]